MDDIDANLKTLSVRGWRRKALDRTDAGGCWRRPRLKEGCSVTDDDDDDNGDVFSLFIPLFQCRDLTAMRWEV
jgi:hypothetical protein